MLKANPIMILRKVKFLDRPALKVNLKSARISSRVNSKVNITAEEIDLIKAENFRHGASL
jgi:hypothetical protein